MIDITVKSCSSEILRILRILRLYYAYTTYYRPLSTISRSVETHCVRIVCLIFLMSTDFCFQTTYHFVPLGTTPYHAVPRRTTSYHSVPPWYEKFENFALFANTGVFIMVFNVYLQYFDKNRLCFEKFPGIA